MNYDPKFSRSALVDQLCAMGSSFSTNGKSCTCPFHEDKNPSANILEGTGGHWRVYCHPCDRHADVHDLIAHASGQDLKDVLPPGDDRKGHLPPVPAKKEPPALIPRSQLTSYCQKAGKVEKWYGYGPEGARALLVARIIQPGGKKTFRQFTPQPNDMVALCNLVPDGMLPLYQVESVRDGESVLVVEGEKCAEAALSVGIPCVTSAMGGGKAGKSNWTPLAGRRVVLWPDHDDIGAKHMDDVAAILAPLGCKVSRIDPAALGLPEKADIADLIEQLDSKSPDEIGSYIRATMEETEPAGASSVLDEWHADVFSGKWQSLPFPWEAMGKLSKAAMPGTVGLLCANPSSGKSWMMLQLLTYWNDMGHKTVCRMFEDELRVHMARLLAHLSNNGKHTDDAWVKLNAGEVKSAMLACRETLDSLGCKIVAETDEVWDHAKLAKWVEEQAKAGARVIMVDPITAVKGDGKPWVEDFALAMKLKIVARTHRCTILLCTHPNKAAKEPELNAVAGGSAWSRFAHNVLWLTGNSEPLGVTLFNGDEAQCNRVLYILKARHGKGTGCRIALEWTEGCRFLEVGLISGKPSKKSGPQQAVPPISPQEKASRVQRAQAKPSASEDCF